QTRVRARVWAIEVEPSEAMPVNDTTPVLAWRRPSATEQARERYWITPSSAAACWQGLSPLRVEEVVRLGPPLSVQRSGDVDWAAFGDTVHGFLAADRRESDLGTRLECARRLLEACSSGARLAPE